MIVSQFRQRARTLLATLCALSLIGIGAARAETLKLATAATEGSVWALQMQRFQEQVHAQGTDLKIELYLASALGDEASAFRNTLSGRVDLWFGAMVAPTTVTPALSALTLPAVFEDPALMPCVVPRLTPHIRTSIGDSYQLLSVGYVGKHALFSRSPVRVPADLEGQKLRSAPLETSIEFFRQTGANPNPIRSVETVSALGLGLVDVVDFPITYAVLVGIHKEAPYFTRTEHRTNLSVLMVGPKSWARLTEAQRLTLQEAADAVTFEENWAEVRAANIKNLEKAKSEGLIDMQLSDSEEELWIEAGQRVWADFVPRMPEEVAGFLDVIRDETAHCQGKSPD